MAYLCVSELKSTQPKHIYGTYQMSWPIVSFQGWELIVGGKILVGLHKALNYEQLATCKTLSQSLINHINIEK
jgi:hypothetical protein